MKTVMKKLLSIALVAILLVSAVPFQAHAEESAIKVPVTVYINGTNNPGFDKTLVVTGDVVLNEELAKSILENFANRSLDKWVSPNGNKTGETLAYSWLATQTDYTLSLYITEKAPAHTHDFKVASTTPATCEKDGKVISECECGAKDTKTLKATGHDMGEWTMDGDVSVRTCKNANCDYTETKSAVKFVSDGETVKTVAIKEGEFFGTLPTPTKKAGYDFVGWFTKPNGAGVQLRLNDEWDGKNFTYYAKWVENDDGTKDGLSQLTIRMRTYTGSTQTNDVELLKVELDDETNILQWLNNNEKRISDAIFSNVDSTKYEWLDRVYYNNDTKAELTSQATLADGDKVVFVKVHAVASTETNVQLYIHQYDSKNKVYNTLKIVDVGGYKAGETITLNKMATVVKKYYSYTSIKGLYTDSTWKQMVNGQNPTASSSITVSSNGTVKYHVILNGSSAASTSTADKTNPKTGDMILVPVMVMLASATAVAFVYLNSKKRAVR